MADLGYAFGLEPEAAVKYFESLGYKVPDNWQTTWTAAQAKARAIAGLHKQELAGHFHGALYDAMQKGTPFEAWRDDVRKRLADAGAALLKDGDVVDTASGEILGSGITKQRLETIFRTQTQNAYMAGKWQSFEETRDFAPYLQYSAILDGRTRQSHAAAHGAVYHIDDSFWDYFYPPNGFNCRCTVRALSDGDLKRRGLSVRESVLEDTNIIINKKGDTRQAKVLKMPDGSRLVADKGFEGNVGKNHLAQLGQLQMQRAVELPPRLASSAIQTALKQPELQQTLLQQVADMVQRVAAEKMARGEVVYMGALSLPILDALAVRKIYPQSAVVAMSDERVLHALRDNKQQPLPLDFWQSLPESLQEPDEVLLGRAGRGEDAKPFLLFVYTLQGGKGKVVVTVDYAAKVRNPTTGKKEKVVVNMVNTGAMLDKAQATSLHGYEQIWKKP